MSAFASRLNPAISSQELIKANGLQNVMGVGDMLNEHPVLAKAIEVAFPPAVPVIEGLKMASTAHEMMGSPLDRDQDGERKNRSPSMAPGLN